MEEIQIEYMDIDFTVYGTYEKGEIGSWDIEPFSGRFNISGINIGTNCVDYILTQRAKEELERLILDKYYGGTI